MTDYTPTTEEVRAAWIDAHRVDTPLGGRMDMEARPRERIREFDRWMASVLAEQGEPEWEYGIAYAPGNEEFEGQDLLTIRRRVNDIRRQGGYYGRTVHAVRRRPAGESEPVEENTPTRTVGASEEGTL